jgi:hypothetical protein
MLQHDALMYPDPTFPLPLLQPLPRVDDVAAVVAFFVDPLGSELLASSSSRMAPGASSSQEAELLTATWQQHPSTHPGRMPAADLFPHLAQVGGSHGSHGAHGAHGAHGTQHCSGACC